MTLRVESWFRNAIQIEEKSPPRPFPLANAAAPRCASASSGFHLLGLHFLGQLEDPGPTGHMKRSDLFEDRFGETVRGRRPALCLGESTATFYYAIRKTEESGFLSVNWSSGQNHIERPALANQSWQTDGPTIDERYPPTAGRTLRRWRSPKRPADRTIAPVQGRRRRRSLRRLRSPVCSAAYD